MEHELAIFREQLSELGLDLVLETLFADDQEYVEWSHLSPRGRKKLAFPVVPVNDGASWLLIFSCLLVGSSLYECSEGTCWYVWRRGLECVRGVVIGARI